MDFREAVERLQATLTRQDIADGLGASFAAVRQALLPPDSQSHRSPPPGWQRGLARLARRRSDELSELADELLGDEEVRQVLEIDASELAQILEQHRDKFKTAMEEQLIEMFERASHRGKERR